MKRMNPLESEAVAAWCKAFVCCAAGILGLMLSSVVAAQTQLPSTALVVGASKVADRSVSEWLMRTHEASRRRAYVGTFVVEPCPAPAFGMSAMVSSRWNVLSP